jgi:hypothetical protein
MSLGGVNLIAAGNQDGMLGSIIELLGIRIHELLSTQKGERRHRRFYTKELCALFRENGRIKPTKPARW